MAPSHADMVRDMKRLLQTIDSKTTSLAAGVMELPSAVYTDPAYWRHEVRELFHRRPIVLALSCELPGPNSYVTLDNVPGFRIFATRDKTGKVRAFLNSCRHRGTPVANGKGTAARFTCPYHGWTYSNSGELLAVSAEALFGQGPCKERALIELPTEERHGLVFGLMDPAGKLDLDAWLGGFGPELESIGLPDMHPMWTRNFRGPNWKVCKDGFIENYHFATLHGKSLPTLMSNVNVTDIWDPHSRILMPDSAIHAQRALPENQWDPPAAFATVYYLFPNTMIASCWGDWPLVTRLFPGLAPNEATCVQTLLSRRAPTPEIRAEADSFQEAYARITEGEDFVLDFAIQQSLENSQGQSFVLGRNEHALQHFHESVARFAGRPGEQLR
jgi:phenylpropionate dioxygenase-like ring-hydroxylating dioxygenase large terminal subunit